MGLFSTARVGQAQTKRDLDIARRRAVRLTTRQLEARLAEAGQFSLDLDEAIGDRTSRNAIEAEGLVQALKVAVETAEWALDEVIRLRYEVEVLKRR